VKYDNVTGFYVLLQNGEKGLLASPGLSVCLSVGMGQLGCHRKDFHEI
jgi:hypothetical protein